MRTIALSDFRRYGKDEVTNLLPILITIEGEVKIVAAKPDEIIVLSDLHPRVRTMLKMLERRARAGMPPMEKIYAPIRDKPAIS